MPTSLLHHRPRPRALWLVAVTLLSTAGIGPFALATATAANPSSRAAVTAPAPTIVLTPQPTKGGDSGGFDAASLGLVVTAGFEGQAVRNTFMPVTVRLEPTRLFSGQLEVASSTGAVETRDVEVAGGAAKEFTFIVPSGSLRVRVRPDGADQAVQVRPDVNGNPAGVLVGIGVRDGVTIAGVPSTAVVGTDQRVLWVPVDATLLERSAQVFTSLGSLVLSDDDLDALSDEGRRNLALAVNNGLNLVLSLKAGPTPDNLPWMPATTVIGATGRTVATVAPAADAWVLTAGDAGLTDPAAPEAPVDPANPTDTAPVAASIPVGNGRVVVTGLSPNTGAGATPGAWALLAAERDATGRLDGEFSSQQGWMVSQALSGGGALDLPTIGLLAAFALVYVLVAGPGNALLLRRLGRNELGWITLPAITVVFVVGAFVTASGTQPKVGLAGSLRTWTDGMGSEIAIAAIRAPSQGTHTIDLPGDGWHVDGTADVNGIQVQVDRSSGNVRASLALQSLQVGTVMGERSIADAPPLDLDLTPLEDGKLEVAITNLGDEVVTNLQLRASGHRLNLGDLEPGASTTGTVDLHRLAQLPAWEDPFEGLKRDDRTGQAEAPGSFRALLRGDLLADRPGQVVVVGERATTSVEVTADGRPTEVVGEVIAVAQSITGGDVIEPGHVNRALLVGAFQQGWQQSPHSIEGQLTAHLRFRLPATAAGRVLALQPDLSRGEGFIEGGIGFGMPGAIEPGFAPPPIAGGRCLEITENNADGSASGSQSCGDVELQIPGCPANAVSCEFSTDGWFFTFEDGTTQRGQITIQDQPDVIFEQNQQQGRIEDAFEIFNPDTSTWRPLQEVLTADGSLSADFVNPFGEVVLRVSGGLFPFDYSARSIGATLTGVRA